MDEALLLALVNHGLIYGVGEADAWRLAESLVAEDGDARSKADRMREAAANTWG